MTREDKIKLAIEKGITCNPETGEVFGVRGGVITGKRNGYIDIYLGGEKRYHLRGHQFIWYSVYNEVVDCIDHINGFKDDNRIENLRSVTTQQNGFNRKSKGYTWHKRAKKWQSQIVVDSETIYLGSFEKEIEAHQAYLDAKKIYHNIN